MAHSLNTGRGTAAMSNAAADALAVALDAILDAPDTPRTPTRTVPGKSTFGPACMSTDLLARYAAINTGHDPYVMELVTRLQAAEAALEAAQDLLDA